ncbi:MAG: hypothetical protein AAFR17_14550 [Pseudomonadota bacterium]
MDEDRQIGWTMAASMGLMGAIVLALIYVPGLRPEDAVLECDKKGGVWSSETRHCQKSDSPLAGMSP